MASVHGSDSGRSRLDLLLTTSGQFPTRARARDAIARGGVRVNGHIVTKPGARFGNKAVIDISDAARSYVSRAALKLIAGLDHFEFDPTGREALDIGASTGGFTQVLLERGASHVTAIDVGHSQLHDSLAADCRVDNHEGVNARALPAELIGGRDIRVLVSDVSFISLKLALPPALAMAASGCFCVLLVKPQFEAGREAIGKGGLVKETAVAQGVVEDLMAWLDNQAGWTCIGQCASPIEGGDGNREFLIGGTKAR